MKQEEKRFYENNNKKATMRDVAKLAGVSISTVSHVINGTRHVSSETSQKVKAAIQDLTFSANLVARNLRSGKSRLIGFVVSNLENYFYIRIAKGIEKIINAHGYHLMLIDSRENKQTEIENVESLYYRGVEGLIIVPTSPDCSYLNSIIPNDYPIVFIDRQTQNFSVDTILLANSDAAYLAVKHLIRSGHVKIGFVAFHFGEDSIDMTMQERIEGYKKALTESDIEINPQFIQVTTGAPSSTLELRYADSYRMMEKLLKTKISAVICGNSLAAVGVFSCLKDKAIDIPKEIALITFDDDPWLTMTSPSISAVAQPVETLGTVAARRLIDRIKGKNLPYECIRLNAEIILRGSS